MKEKVGYSISNRALAACPEIVMSAIFVVRFCLGLDASIPEKKSRAFTSLYPSLVMYFIVAVS